MRLKPTDGVLSRYPNIRDCSSIGAKTNSGITNWYCSHCR